MAQPPPYVITTDFSEEEEASLSGRSTVRTVMLDAELANIASTLAVVLANLVLIQRDDGKLADEVVELHTLSAAVRAVIAVAGVNPRGDWVTATAYASKDVVSEGTGTYLCVVAHTSGVFATDLTAVKWILIFDTAAYVATGVAFTPAGTITAGNVQAALEEVASEAAQKAANLSDLANTDTARTNIGAISAAEVATGSRVMGANCNNKAGTPNTQYDLDADEVVLRDVSGNSIVSVNPGAALTNNISTLGPAANCRDQAGAFTNSSWVHFYWIWNGATLATLSSATAPPTGPTLPTGYTHWSYAGAVFLSSGGALQSTRIKGSVVYYVQEQSVLSGGTAAVETSVSLSTLIPPNALSFTIHGNINPTADAGGVLDFTTRLRFVSGIDFWAGRWSLSGLANTAQIIVFHSILFPNVSQTIFYLTTMTNGTNTGGVAFAIESYKVPNGGE